VYTPLVRLAAERSTESAFEFAEKSRSRVLRENLGVASSTTATLAALLSEHETVVEYFVDGADLLVFCLTRDGVPATRLPSAALEIEPAVRNLERHIASCSVGWERMAAAAHHQMRTAESHLEHLYNILIRPVSEGLRRRVAIVPHGTLHRVPFHAL